MSTQSLCALLLLAGTSKRFGHDNKLLANIDGVPICAHALKTLLNTSIKNIIVITGHDQGSILSALNKHTRLATHVDAGRIQVIHNEFYNAGMRGSIAAGLHKAASFDAAMICLGDMPYISVEVIESLKAAWESDGYYSAFVPEYNKHTGNPVILTQAFFPKLMSSNADIGARDLLRENKQYVLKVPVTSDAIFRDIDMISDLPTH